MGVDLEGVADTEDETSAPSDPHPVRTSPRTSTNVRTAKDALIFSDVRGGSRAVVGSRGIMWL